MGLPNITAEDALRAFLAEDVGYGDITSNALVEPNIAAVAQIVCREDAMIAGIEEALTILRIAGCEGTAKINDGARAKAGETVLVAQGPARALLSAERILLNLLSHMSGVATATSDLVSAVAKERKGGLRVACTRKTLPGLRFFEKKAVQVGGGDTHRLRLDDAVLVKDNHLAVAGSIGECVRKARSSVSFTKKIEVEAATTSQALEAAEAGADIVLLDNMSPKQIVDSVNLLKSKGLRQRLVVEASGGITKENIASYANTGVDVVSVGAITHSARAIDMSMEIRASKRRG